MEGASGTRCRSLRLGHTRLATSYRRRKLILFSNSFRISRSDCLDDGEPKDSEARCATERYTGFGPASDSDRRLSGRCGNRGRDGDFLVRRWPCHHWHGWSAQVLRIARAERAESAKSRFAGHRRFRGSVGSGDGGLSCDGHGRLVDWLESMSTCTPHFCCW